MQLGVALPPRARYTVMRRRAGVGLALGVAAMTACAAAPRVRRARGLGPSDEAADAAFEAASARARRCLGDGHSVTVGGFFDGASGMFLAERVAASEGTPVRVQQCVSVALERARVAPFAEARRDAEWTLAPRVRATLAGSAAVPAAPEVMGEVDAAAVTAMMRAETPEARRCYDDALRGSPTLAGRVTVRFTLSVDGRITHAVASGPRGFRAVGHCVVGHLRGLQWPAARGAPVEFEFPLQFTPMR